MGEIVLWVIVVILLLTGVVGSLLPVIPGTPIVLLAAVVYGFFTEFREVTVATILVLAGITVLAQVIDWLASVFGAKRRRASRWGLLGGVVGGIMGVWMAGIVGLPVGIFVVSFLAEWALGGRELSEAIGVGWASLLGFLAGTLVRFLLALTMVGIFLYSALG